MRMLRCISCGVLLYISGSFSLSVNSAKRQSPVLSKEQWPTSDSKVAETVPRQSSLQAPLVDSTLLRFLSKQKKNPPPRVKNGSAPTTTAAPTISASTTTDESQNAWLGQYNRNRVANTLMLHGASEEEAQMAGQSVQNYVLTKSARRRVRQFLKQRDDQWRQPPNGTQNTSLVTPLTNDTLSYGLDQVVEEMLSFNLTGKDMSAILTHTPSVSLILPQRSMMTVDNNGETLHEILTRTMTLLQTTLNLRRYDARKLLRRTPGLLTKRGSQAAEQNVVLLHGLGVSLSSIARDKNRLPKLLSRSPKDLFRLAAFLSSDAVRMPLGKIGPLMRSDDSVLDMVAPVPTEPHNATLWRRQRDDIPNLYKDMTETAWALRAEIGISDLGTVLAAYPSVLLLDLDEQIIPLAFFLMDDLGMSRSELPRVLQSFPALLGKDLNSLQTVVDYLLSLGVSQENLPRIFRAFPAVLTLDIERDMKPVVEFLLDIGISDVGRFVTRLPPILGYSVERELAPKWQFLNQVCHYGHFEVSRFPAFFSYPMERVILTRYDYLRKIKRIPLQLLKVDRVLRFGDKDFAKLVAGDEDGGAAFAAFAKRRRKYRLPKRSRKHGRGRPRGTAV